MKHFNRSEFACKCGCGFDVVDEELAEVCDAVRRHFGVPVTVTSGCRCARHNKKVGGKEKSSVSKGSQHLYGRAADLQVAYTDPSEVQSWVRKNFPEISIGSYDSFTHLDSRSDGPAYW